MAAPNKSFSAQGKNQALNATDPAAHIQKPKIETAEGVKRSMQKEMKRKKA